MECLGEVGFFEPYAVARSRVIGPPGAGGAESVWLLVYSARAKFSAHWRQGGRREAPPAPFEKGPRQWVSRSFLKEEWKWMVTR